MGVVYAARHEVTGRALAIKLLRPEFAGRADLVRRVSAEARLAVEASHPNVVEVLDAGADELDIPYLVLERLYGHPLDELLHEPLPLVAASQALLPVINALAVLHRLGIVHRDIKPSNIFLSREEDGRVRPKLLDFGIAKALEGAGSTLSGVAVGTPAYMAPEQALGYRVGPATDIWSMAVVLARCLTGRLPFEGVATRHAGTLFSGLQPEDLPGVPEPVAQVVVAALQLEPARRPASMEEFRGALLSALGSVSPQQGWPSEGSVDYPRESELALLLENRRDADEASDGGGGQRARAQGRAAHVLTRTLSKVRQTTSGLNARSSALRGSVVLLAAVAAAWALQASSRRAPASQQRPAVALEVEALQPGTGVTSQVASNATAPPSSASTTPPAPELPARSQRETTAVPLPHSPRARTPTLLRDTGIRRARAVRGEATPPSPPASATPDASPVQSAALVAPAPAVGANRSPIIE